MVGITQAENRNDVWEVTWKFEDSSFETLQEIAEEQVFRSGTTVFKEGDPADGMYLVLKGAAIITRRLQSGEERTVAIVTEGQSFGEIGLLVDHPRRATVVAGTDIRVLKITRTVLDLLHKNAPDMAYMMYQVLARSLAEQLMNTIETRQKDD